MNPKSYSSDELLLLLNEQLENNTQALNNLSLQIKEHYVTKEEISLVAERLNALSARQIATEKSYKDAISWLVRTVFGLLILAGFVTMGLQFK